MIWKSQGSSDKIKDFERNLWLGVIVLSMLAAGFTAYAIYSSWLNQTERARTATQNLALAVETEVADIFDKTDLALRNLADNYADNLTVNRFPANKWNAELLRQRLFLKVLGGIRATDSAGTIAYGLTTTDARNISIVDRDYFITHRDNPNAGLFVSQPVLARVTNNWSLVLSRRLSDNDGKFSGVVAATIPLNLLKERFAMLKLGVHGSVGMRDGDLRLIVRYPALTNGGEIGTTRTADEFKAALQLDKSLGSYHAGITSIDGIQRIHSYRRTSQYGFYINVGVSEEEYLATWRTDALRAVIALVIFLLLIVIFALLIRQAWNQHRSLTDRLSNSESRFRKMFQQNDSVMLIIEPESGAIEDANAAAERFYGYPIERLKSMTIQNINTLPPEDIAKLRDQANHHDRNTFTFPHRLANGEVRTVDVHSSPISIEDRRLLFSIIQDITERKQIEIALQNSEEHSRAIVEACPIPFVLRDGEHGFTYLNSAFINTFGYTLDDVPSLQEWKCMVFPNQEDWQSLEQSFQSLMNEFQGGSQTSAPLEIEIRCKDKSVRSVLVQVTRIGLTFKREYLASFYDITERNTQEQQRIEREITHRTTLVREVHHRIKNNLQSVAGLLQRELGKFLVINPRLEVAISQINVIAVAHGLQGTDSSEVIRLHEVVSKICQTVSSLKQQPVLFDPTPTLALAQIEISSVEAVSTALVLNELILNAVKHSPSGSPAVAVTLLSEGQDVQLHIRNSVQTNFDFDFNNRGKEIGTGLNLVHSLLPEQGAKLTYSLDGENCMVTCLTLSPPVVGITRQIEAARF